MTDLGVLTHWTNKELVVFVHDLVSLEPTLGAKVQLFSEKRQLIASGISGSDGLLRLEFEGDRHGAPAVLVVETDDDYTFLDLKPRDFSGKSAMDGLLPYDAEQYDAFLFADRNLYRPGEIVHLGCTIRKNYGDAVADLPFILKILKPNGKELEQKFFQTNDQGNGTWDLQTRNNFPTGRYIVQAMIPGKQEELGSFQFNLEEFVPERMEVHASLAEGENLIWRKPARLVLEGSHLFGAPAADLQSEAEILYKTSIYTDDRYPGFHFGNNFDASSQLVRLGRLETDQSGRAEFAVQFPDWAKLKNPLRADLRGRVYEIGGRFVADRFDCWVFPDEVMYGIRCTAAPNQKLVTVEVVAITSDGETADVGEAVVELMKVTNFYSLRHYISHNSAYIDDYQTLVSTDNVALANGRGSITLNLEDDCGYVIRVHGAESQMYSSEIVRSAWGGVEVGEGDKPSLLKVSTKSEEYVVGDTARVRIEAPFDGLGFLIVEGDRLYRAIPFEIKDQVAEVSFHVPPDYYPNVWIGASVIHSFREGRSQILPFSAFCAVNMRVRDLSRELKIEVMSPPEVLLPDAHYDQEFMVTDSSGRPVEADVMVALVDVGIHQILGWQLPDPIKWLGRPRGTALNYAHYYDKVAYNFDSPVFGGGLGRIRNYVGLGSDTWIKPMALWSGMIRTGSDGRGTVSFDVPEFSGRGRLQFVTLGASGLGSESLEIPITRPWTMQPYLPRFLVMGDKSLQQIGFHNRSGETLRFVVEISASMNGETHTDYGRHEVVIPPGGQDRLALDLVGPQAAGTFVQKWDIEVVKEDGTVLDQVTRTFPIAVEASSNYASSFETLVLEPGTSRRVGLDGYLDNSLAELQVTVAAHPFMRLDGALRYVASYPYGCVEQTTSKLMSMYLLRAQKFLMEGSLDGTQDLDVYFSTGVQKLLSMQNPDGGLTYWSGMGESHRYGSIYALHFLSLLKEDRRIPLPEEQVQNLEEYVLGLVQDGRLVEPEELYLRAYACYVLALAGEPSIGDEIERFDDYALSPAGRYLLAAAVARITGQASAAKAYLARVPIRVFEDTVSDLTLSSDIRNTAVEFMALYQAGVRGEELQQRLDDLMTFLSGRQHGTTQESAFVITALADYLIESGRNIESAGWVVADSSGNSESMEGATHSRKSASGVESYFDVQNTGETDLFVNVIRRGIPTETQQEDIEEGIEFERLILDTEGNEIDGTEYIQRGSYLIGIRLKVDRPLRYVVVADRIPAGLEITNPVLGGDNGLPLTTLKQPLKPSMVDKRDDRMVYSYDRIEPGEHWFYYGVQAVSPGNYSMPGLIAETMYDPANRARERIREIVVKAPDQP
jgi:uncharacterized protein YfaS (alpha-2-macroglobulin family)